MDALELTMKCSKLLKKPYSSSTATDDIISNLHMSSNTPTSATGDSTFLNASILDSDFEISRLTGKEGSCPVFIVYY
jgi:hypothetical protein